jgi:hypothetical protein
MHTDRLSPCARVSGRNRQGVKTTVSMPSDARADFIAAFGGEQEFRAIFNNVLKSAQPRPGYPLSLIVRMTLERRAKTARAARRA